MLEFLIQNFRPRGNPIGIDFGASAIRLAQAQIAGDGHRLDAAASHEWDSDEREILTSDEPLTTLHIETLGAMVSGLLKHTNFAGRRAIVALPARWTSIVPMQLPPMNARATQQAIRTVAEGKLPSDPREAVIRPITLGTFDTVAGPMQHMLLMAAPRRRVQGMLDILNFAGLKIANLIPEPLALVEACRKIYRRGVESRTCFALVDIGPDSTRLAITHGGNLLHASCFDIGADLLAKSMTEDENASIDDARLTRIKRRSSSWSNGNSGGGVALAGGTAVASPSRVAPMTLLTHRLRNEIRTYNAAADCCVSELIFTGGEAKQDDFCQTIGDGLDLSWRVADPLACFSRDNRASVAAGIDRRQPQPQWTLAIGLSLGKATRSQ